VRVFSFGGGVQSMAVLVLAAQGTVQYDAFLFANVGDDSEHPDTLAYVRDVARPYAAQHGLRLEEIRRQRRDGQHETLFGWLHTRKTAVPIPVRMANGAPGNRDCTGNFKVRPVARWLREHGATRENPATVGLGISLDEFHRAKSSSPIPYQRLEYPLLDLRLNRRDCRRIIEDGGLPVPPKSACWFCPFRPKTEWRRLKHDRLDLFNMAVDLERMFNDRRASWGKDAVYLTDGRQPLDLAIAGDQMTLDDAMDTCESGYCFV
jgi:hypothetical protein